MTGDDGGKSSCFWHILGYFDKQDYKKEGNKHDQSQDLVIDLPRYSNKLIDTLLYCTHMSRRTARFNYYFLKHFETLVQLIARVCDSLKTSDLVNTWLSCKKAM